VKTLEDIVNFRPTHMEHLEVLLQAKQGQNRPKYAVPMESSGAKSHALCR